MIAFECGLVVGKFAPLHRGHQHVIDTALGRCRHVVLLTYSDPELSGCEPERRARWLAELYPQTTRLVVTPALLEGSFPGEARRLPPNEASDERHRAFVVDLLRHVARRTVDAVFTSESYGDGFAEHLERAFGRPVEHVLVDEARSVVPISAREIRRDVHAARRWLDPAVYASFVERVVCLGGESSGKSVLAEALARELGTVHVAEYGRELWVERGGDLRFDDLLDIAREQVEREEGLARRADRHLLCDTSPLTTLFYSLELFGRAAPELATLAERPYALTVLCAPDFEFVQDGTRREAGFRERQHRWYRAELARRGVPFLEVTGSVRSRVEQVRDALRRGDCRAA